jgi:hypothetical protein
MTDAMAVGLMFSFLGAVGIYAFGNRVAMDAEGGGGVDDSPLVAAVRFLDVELFELFQSFIEADVAV